MKKKKRGRILKIILTLAAAALIICAAFVIAVNVYMTASYKKYIETAPENKKFRC